MITRLSAFVLVTCLALSNGAYAQETATEEETPSTVPSSEGDLNLGEDTSKPQVGQTYVREIEQDWGDPMRAYRGRRKRTLPDVSAFAERSGQPCR